MSPRENRPTEGAVHEAPTKKLSTSLAESALTFEDREAARLAGVDQGRAERVELEAENRALELLHDFACESLNLARRSARHGPAFSQLVRESGERE